MAKPDKQHTGDGSDNYMDATRNAADAARQARQLSQAPIGRAATAGSKATASAAAATARTGAEGGRAAVEIAAGSTAGGPWGAALAAAWAMRHTLCKTLICVCLSMLFLTVLLVSLPSIVFNAIFRTDPASVPVSGPTDMLAVYEEMSAAVSACVSSGYAQALAEVERIIKDGGYDYTLSTEATANYGHVSADYDVCYILAAYSACMGQKGTTKDGLESKLGAVSLLIFPVTYEARETVVTVAAENEGEEPTETTVKYAACTIHPFEAAVILAAFGIDPDAPYGQFGIPMGEAIESMAMALKRTLYGVTASGQVPPITDAELAAFLEALECSPARVEIMRAALSLVGRVPYFWGGKSASGWNEDWNSPKLVASAGSSSTGTLRPYGMDCSGFTDWAYTTALGTGIGVGSATQWENSTSITEAELLPGDLGFLDIPGAVPVNHVLLYAGKDAGGNLLWVHCASASGGVTLNAPSYVKYYRRIDGVDLETVAVS